ncbi:MAG TPA: hypothetical protein VK253_01940 [Candidatus Binatia bacterium]|nr:hypothetical protein [Candidatus Binatia bacterium]
MASGPIDHMTALVVFMAAFLIFIGLFSQTMQTGIAYERHNALSTKTSDLLDNMLLNPGIPGNWGKNDVVPVGFGLQDPDYSQYKLSSSSLMRLSSAQSPVYYNGAHYVNVTAGFGGYLFAPTAKSLNYSSASKLLGINDTYGFQLTLNPTITVSIQNPSTSIFSVNAHGTGYPFANAPLSYSLVLINRDADDYPSYTVASGTGVTDVTGSAQLVFPQITSDDQSYALLVYSYLNGLKGMGYYVHDSPFFTKTIIPVIESFQDGTIILVHGDSVGQPPQPPVTSQLNYNATFVILTDDNAIRQVELDQPASVGSLVYSGSGQDSASLTVPNNDGILIVTYKSASGQYGVVLMPWGFGSLAFPLTFGGNPAGQEWVTTDLRQVNIGGINYQAKLELWNLQGISESS